MKVTLINHTQDASTLLLFTKSTRLSMSPGLMDEIRSWPAEKKLAELEYMSKTIRSSLEFVDFIFLIEGVSRATAQQITRTRQASYAMQSQRVTDVRSMEIVNPRPDDPLYNEALEASRANYARLVDAGVPLEDARGVLPMNASCNLVAKYNLRAFSDLCATRASLRAQGEYSAIAREMKRLVLEAHPEFAPFFAHPADLAIQMIEGVAKELGITPGSGPGWELAKAADLLRKS